MKKLPRITNDLDKVVATLKFRKLKLIETVSLVEEIRQLRGELKDAEAMFAEVGLDNPSSLIVKP
jgi:hypothetical protein